jgi:hypothetical protein
MNYFKHYNSELGWRFCVLFSYLRFALRDRTLLSFRALLDFAFALWCCPAP